MLANKTFRSALLALPVVALAAQSAEAGSYLHEYPNRTILEISCTRTGSQTLVLAQATPQDGGSVNFASVVFTAGAAIRSDLIERNIPAGARARVGHIFFGVPTHASATGYFSGISGAGNPATYSIPTGVVVNCSPPIY